MRDQAAKKYRDRLAAAMKALRRIPVGGSVQPFVKWSDRYASRVYIAAKYSKAWPGRWAVSGDSLDDPNESITITRNR